LRRELTKTPVEVEEEVSRLQQRTTRKEEGAVVVEVR
jgi:hypothetical protein